MKYLVMAIMLLATPVIAEDSILTLNGTGTVQAEPDMGFFSVQVKDLGATPQAAMEASTKSLNKVFKHLESCDVSKQCIATTNFSLSENWKPVETGRNDNNGRPITKTVQDGWVVSSSLKITIKDLPKMSSALSGVVSEGNQSSSVKVGGIGFGYSKPEEKFKQARALAVKDALAKATTIVDTLDNLKLSSVKAISENSYGRPTLRSYSESSRSDALPKISGGMLNYTISVNIKWALENKE